MELESVGLCNIFPTFTETCLANKNCIYWVGKKVHLGFSITSYRKSRSNFFWPTEYLGCINLIKVVQWEETIQHDSKVLAFVIGFCGASLVTQTVKSLPAMQEIQV